MVEKGLSKQVVLFFNIFALLGFEHQVSHMLGKYSTTEPHPQPDLFYFLKFIYLFIYFAVLGIERRGVLPPHYTPGPIFLCFIFETGSHEVAEGLAR